MSRRYEYQWPTRRQKTHQRRARRRRRAQGETVPKFTTTLTTGK